MKNSNQTSFYMLLLRQHQSVVFMLLAGHHQSAIPLLSFITRIAKLKNLSSTFISFTHRTVPMYLSFTFILYSQNITKCVVLAYRIMWMWPLYFRSPANAHTNTVLWNAMINPFLRSTIFGALWYQGMSNIQYKKTCKNPYILNKWILHVKIIKLNLSYYSLLILCLIRDIYAHLLTIVHWISNSLG